MLRRIGSTVGAIGLMAGVLWLGGCGGEEEPLPTPTLPDSPPPSPTVGDRFQDAGRGIREAAESTGTAIEAGAQEAGEAVRTGAQRTGEALRDAGEAAKREADEAAERVGETIEQIEQKMRTSNDVGSAQASDGTAEDPNK